MEFTRKSDRLHKTGYVLRETGEHVNKSAIAARIDEYAFITRMVAGIEYEGWYQRRLAQLRAMCEVPAAQAKDKAANFVDGAKPEDATLIPESGIQNALIARFTHLIHQERVRLSGVYSQAFGAKDVTPEEVASYNNQTTATWQNAIEIIKSEMRKRNDD